MDQSLLLRHEKTPGIIEPDFVWVPADMRDDAGLSSGIVIGSKVGSNRSDGVIDFDLSPGATSEMLDLTAVQGIVSMHKRLAQIAAVKDPSMLEVRYRGYVWKMAMQYSISNTNSNSSCLMIFEGVVQESQARKKVIGLLGQVFYNYCQKRYPLHPVEIEAREDRYAKLIEHYTKTPTHNDKAFDNRGSF